MATHPHAGIAGAAAGVALLAVIMMYAYRRVKQRSAARRGAAGRGGYSGAYGGGYRGGYDGPVYDVEGQPLVMCGWRAAQPVDDEMQQQGHVLHGPADIARCFSQPAHDSCRAKHIILHSGMCMLRLPPPSARCSTQPLPTCCCSK
jgi:hypothetical protein